MKPLTIYVAGPYSAPTPEQVKANVQKAIDIGTEIFKRGHYPYIPHLNWMIEERLRETGQELWSWQNWMDFDRPWLDKSDAIFYIAPSTGTDLERGIAKTQGKPIFYDLDDIPYGGD
jgi:hypothetical protein